jgi:hypothetical protein
MTPKEKCDELVDKFDGDLITDKWDEVSFIDFKQCALIYALICVNEIIETISDYECDVWNKEILIYWQEVKTEIELL